MCRAIPLDSQKKILCYHDDDARPGVAFDVFDWEGKNIFSFPVQGDVLSLKVSSDQTRILLGLTQGRVILLNVDDEFKKIWEAKLDGEIVDFAISESSPENKSERIVVLTTGKKGQWVHTLDHEGHLTRKVRTPAAWNQVEITPDGTRISGYGNGPGGQSLWMLTSEDLKQQWQRTDPRYADYSSTMTSFNDMTLIGFEEVSPKTRHSHLLAFNPNGEIRWNLPLITEEGAYLYTRAFSPSSSMLVVGTDDAVLSGYRIEQGTQN